MKFYVKAILSDAIFRPDDVIETRRVINEQLRILHNSGKLLAGGMIADGRGAVFVINVDTSIELLRLIGPAFLDRCNIESHALLSFDEIEEFFQEQSEHHKLDQ